MKLINIISLKYLAWSQPNRVPCHSESTQYDQMIALYWMRDTKSKTILLVYQYHLFVSMIEPQQMNRYQKRTLDQLRELWMLLYQ